MFPEIAKAIQMRRAQYYLLNDGYSFINQMISKGHIEEKDGAKLKNEIDNMIISLDGNQPDINLDDQYSRILHYSKLADIFDHKELKIAF